MRTLFILIFFSSTVLAADVYKWVDEKGEVHYGSSPVGKNAEEVKIAPAPEPDPYLEQRREDLKASQEQRQTQQKLDAERQKEVDQAKQYQDQVKELCKKYEYNLKLLEESGRRVYTVDATGKYTYFSDEERAKKITDIKEKMAETCKDVK